MNILVIRTISCINQLLNTNLIWLVRFQGRKCLEKAHKSSQAPVHEMLLGGRFRREDLRIRVGHKNKIHEIYERKWKQYLRVRLFL